MNKEDRAQRLSESLVKVRGYSLPPLETKPKRDTAPRNGEFQNFEYGEALERSKELPALWLSEENKPGPIFHEHRTARESPLIALARRYPVRLPLLPHERR